MIDEMRFERIARTAAAAALADVEATIDVEAAWHRFRSSADAIATVRAAARAPRRPARTWLAWSAAAVVAVGAAVAVIGSSGGDRRLRATTASPGTLLGPAGSTTPGTGLPPGSAAKVAPPDQPLDPGALLDRLGATQLVLRSTDQVEAVTPSSTARIPVPGDRVRWVGGFVVTETVQGDVVSSTAFDIRGRRVCSADGLVYRLRVNAAGSGLVASVTRPWTMTAPIGEVPSFAVDCRSGNSTAIAPAQTRSEGGSTATDYLGNRSYHVAFSADGNARITDDQHVDVLGGDAAVTYVFDDRGTAIAYGVLTDNPQVTDTVAVRDLAASDIPRWRVAVGGSVGALWWVGDRVVVAVSGDLTHPERTSRLVVLDGSTGQVVDAVDSSLPVVAVSAADPSTDPSTTPPTAIPGAPSTG